MHNFSSKLSQIYIFSSIGSLDSDCTAVFKFYFEKLPALRGIILSKSLVDRGVEIPCPTRPTRDILTSDKWLFSIKLSADKQKINSGNSHISKTKSNWWKRVVQSPHEQSPNRWTVSWDAPLPLLHIFSTSVLVPYSLWMLWVGLKCGRLAWWYFLASK